VFTSNYLEELKKRKKKSHIYRKYQLTGLEISSILEDEKHKSLYIKLAKDHRDDQLLALAKTIAEKRGIKNRGAYFMSCLKELKTKRKKGR